MEIPAIYFHSARMSRVLVVIVVCLIAVSISCVQKQAAVSGPDFSDVDFISKDIVFESKHFRYRVFVPKDKAPEERLPVMLYLHGSDERGDDNQGQLSGPAPSILANPNLFRFVIVFPQCPVGRFWDKEMIEVAMTELDQTVKEFDSDESQLYLAGFSLGGYGTWSAAAMYPDKFAAVVPMSGRIIPRPGERRNVAPEIIELADAPDPFAAFANRLKNTSVWIFHGANDNIVPVDSSRLMAKALKNAGNMTSMYTELENTGHVSLTAAFREPELFKWLAKQRIRSK